MKKRKNKTDDLVDCLIKKTQECEKLKDALQVILMNTINRSFKGDAVYKSGVLTNIRMALGDEEYDMVIKQWS